MIWLGLIAVIIGYILYRADKKIKAKFEATFNPEDWGLPITAGTPSAAKPITASITYEKKDSLFSPAEKLLFDALQSAMAMEYQLLAKISVADAIKLQSPGEISNANHIITKQFDFVICDKSNFSLLCAIDFNDKIQQQNVAVPSDSAIAIICQSAQLPLITINKQLQYDVQRLRAQILTAIHVVEIENKQVQKFSDAVNKNSHKDVIDTAVLNACPKCAAVMVKRRARNHEGQEEKLFWVCTHYPECRGLVAVTTISTTAP